MKIKKKETLYFSIVCFALYAFFFSPGAEQRRFRKTKAHYETRLRKAVEVDERFSLVKVQTRGTAWKSPTRIAGTVSSQEDLQRLQKLVQTTLKDLNYKFNVTVSPR